MIYSRNDPAKLRAHFLPRRINLSIYFEAQLSIDIETFKIRIGDKSVSKLIPKLIPKLLQNLWLKYNDFKGFV